MWHLAIAAFFLSLVHSTPSGLCAPTATFPDMRSPEFHSAPKLSLWIRNPWALNKRNPPRFRPVDYDVALSATIERLPSDYRDITYHFWLKHQAYFQGSGAVRMGTITETGMERLQALEHAAQRLILGEGLWRLESVLKG